MYVVLYCSAVCSLQLFFLFLSYMLCYLVLFCCVVLCCVELSYVLVSQYRSCFCAVLSCVVFYYFLL